MGQKEHHRAPRKAKPRKLKRIKDMLFASKINQVSTTIANISQEIEDLQKKIEWLRGEKLELEQYVQTTRTKRIWKFWRFAAAHICRQYYTRGGGRFPFECSLKVIKQVVKTTCF